jgi:ABC-type sugar transport system permease subunit
MATADDTVSTGRGTRTATLKQWWEILRNVRQEEWGDTSGYLFLAPGLIIFIIFQIWPLFRGFSMAFTDFAFLKQLTDPTHFVGLTNFQEFLFEDRQFWPALGRSLKFTAFYLPLMLGLGLFMASVIARVVNSHVAGFFRTSMYLPVILPSAVAVLLWRTLLNNQYGYFNYLLRDILGWHDLALNWLNDPRTVIYVVALMRIWRDAGVSAMLFLIGMYGINEELYDSAAVDGANGFQQWRFITIPLLKPMLVVVLVLNATVVSAAYEFMITYDIGSLGPEGEALTLGYYNWLLSFWWPPMRFGYGASISLFMGIISLILSVIVFRAFRTERA